MTDGDVILLERLRYRTELLLRVLNTPRPPKNIVGMITEHVLSTAAGYCGDDSLAFWMAHRMLADIRKDHGVCKSCGKARVAAFDLCADCVFDALELDKEDGT